jgi:diguanylate cyclase (GGDEF)-like protein
VTLLTLLFGAELSLIGGWLILAGCGALACSLILSWRCVRLRAENRALREQCAILERSCLGHLAAEAALDERRLLSGWFKLAGKGTGTLVLVDVEAFHLILKEYGAAVAEEVLEGVEGLIRSSIRKQDFACRWDGDQFVIYFCQQDIGRIENRLRELATRLKRFELRGLGPLPVGIDWGIARQPASTMEEAISAADADLFWKKMMRREAAPRAGSTAAAGMEPVLETASAPTGSVVIDGVRSRAQRLTNGLVY